MNCEQYADIIFTNGKIYTVNEKREWAEAVAIKGKKIIAVGRNEEVELLKNSETVVVDIEGKMMLPGFVECHAHPIMASFFKSGIVFEFTMSLDEVLSAVKEYITNNPDKEVYFGQGYSEWLFDQNGPRKELLDEICPDKPIILIGGGIHSAWCNSKAMEIAGITKDTLDPDPGAQFYRRDPDGTPIGSLVESGPIREVVDAIKPFCEEDVIRAFHKISDSYSRAGVTSINDGGNFDYVVDAGRMMTSKILKEQGLKQRIRSCGFVTVLPEVENAVEEIVAARELYNDEHFKVDYMKVLNDGSSEARSCAMIEPYEDGTVIHPMLEGKALQDLCLEAAEAGLDIHIHAIGDWTIRENLEMAKFLREKGYMDVRIVNIHSNYTNPEDIDMFKKYDVIANATPVWFYDNPTKIHMLGEKRVDKTFLLNSIQETGAKVTFCSDFPADEYGKEPLKGIEMGITRQLFGKPDSTILKPFTERMTVKKMIEGYTINAAYQMHIEDKVGSIEIGKIADMIILDENLFEIDPHDIHNVKVLKTVFEGKVVFEEK